MKLGSCGLTVREVVPYQQTSVELTPRKIARWVKDLPKANLGDCSRLSYRLLVEANQTILEPAKRLAILNSIEPLVRDLVNSLENQFIHQRIALSEKQKKIAALMQALQTELIIGYHTLIESLLSTPSPAVELNRSQRKHLLIALIMASQYHGLVMLRNYQLYASIPSRSWREVYRLYQLACLYELAQTSDRKVTLDKTMTVEKSLKRTLMLSLANPYQLRQIEINQLWQLLPQLVERASLSASQNKAHFYQVPLSQGQPPQHMLLKDEETQEDSIYFSLSAVVDKLNQMLAQSTAEQQSAWQKTMLWRHLVFCWDHETHRAFARTPCEGQAQVSFGLGATHFHLSAETDRQNGIQSSDQPIDILEGSLKNASLSLVSSRQHYNDPISSNYLSASSAVDRDIWAKLYRENSEEDEKQNSLEKRRNQYRSRDSIIQESYRAQQVDLLNISPNGYCFEIDAELLPSQAQTGEILGFLELNQNKGERWNIAVVRWVRRKIKSNRVQMGIQLLAPGATAVNLQLRNSRSESNDFQRALILPALTGVGQPATLITNPLAFSGQSKVRIIESLVKYDARLSQELAANSSFRQFSFEQIGDETPLNPKPKNQTEGYGDSPLDGIWDNI